MSVLVLEHYAQCFVGYLHVQNEETFGNFIACHFHFHPLNKIVDLGKKMLSGIFLLPFGFRGRKLLRAKLLLLPEHEFSLYLFDFFNVI